MTGVKSMEARYSRDWKKAGREMLEDLQARMMPAKWEFERFYKKRNKAIDTPESYAAVFARCEDWLRGP